MLQKNSATPAAPLINSLHWFPVHSRINFKIDTITYKSLHSLSPSYLASVLHHYTPARNLRSSNSLLLSSHPAKTNFGLHAFQSAAPSIGLARVFTTSCLGWPPSLPSHFFASGWTGSQHRPPAKARFLSFLPAWNDFVYVTACRMQSEFRTKII